MVVAQKRPGRPKTTGEEVLENDRQKLRMVSTLLRGEGAFEEDWSDNPYL